MSPLTLFLVVIVVLCLFGGFYGGHAGWYAGGPTYIGNGLGGVGILLLIVVLVLVLR